LKGKWHFGATFIDNEGKNVIGCLMNITGARGTDHPPFSNFLLTNLFSIKFLYFFIISILLKTVKNNIVACLCNAFYTNLSLWNTTIQYNTIQYRYFISNEGALPGRTINKEFNTMIMDS
jgi:hypothetical protein